MEGVPYSPVPPLCPQSDTVGAVPWKTVERRARQRAGVLGGLLWSSLDADSQGMVQCSARRPYAVAYDVRLWNEPRSLSGQGEGMGKNCLTLMLPRMVWIHAGEHGIGSF